MANERPLTPEEIDWVRRFMEKPYMTLSGSDLDADSAKRIVLKIFASRLADKAKNDPAFQDDPILKDLAHLVTEAQAEKKKKEEENKLLKGKMKKYVGIGAAVVIGAILGATAYLAWKTNTIDIVELNSQSNVIRRENEEFKKKANAEIGRLTQTIAIYQTEISALSGKMGGLETAVAEKAGKKEQDDALARKIDTTAFDLKIAELNKQYANLKSALDAEVAKNPAREEAYTKLAARAEETRTLFEGFVKKYNAFEAVIATKDYSDKSTAALRRYVDDEFKPKIAEGKTAVEGLRKDYGEDNKELRRLAGIYNTFDEVCRALDARLKKVESENKSGTVPDNKQ
ncbi:MAG: hypothetical protein MUF61_00610 [archaeon]|nr:hypothetical protein [archaeon]